MTILQTLITKGDRKSKQDTKAILNASAEIEEESEPVRNEFRTKKRPIETFWVYAPRDRLTASFWKKIIVRGSRIIRHPNSKE